MGPNGSGLAIASIHGRFEAQVVRQPASIAVTADGETVTYDALNARAAALAQHLSRRGIGRSCLVGVFGDHSIPVIEAVFGVLKVGAAYMPLDSTYPKAYLSRVLEVAQLAYVLVPRQSDGMETLASVDCDCYEDSYSDPAGVFREGVRPDPLDPAVVISTSGSTGQPKPVVLSHASICSRFDHGYQYQSGDIQRASLATVGHFSDLLLPLCCGGMVRIPPASARMSLSEQVKYLAAAGARRAVFVPSQLRAILEADSAITQWLRGLQSVIVSGEQVSPALVQRFKCLLPWARLINGYGATEAAGLVTMADVTDLPSVSAGFPIKGSSVDVVGDDLTSVRPGDLGEICIAGEQLAIGYLQKPSLTDERFPILTQEGLAKRVYRTGDFGRLTQNGLEIIGRLDDEIRLNGRRANLCHIETVLESLAPPRTRVFVSKDGGESNRRLVAYWHTSDDGDAFDPAAARRDVTRHLPRFMVPSTFRRISRIPTLPNGKIDRLRLSDVVVDDPPAGVPRIDAAVFLDPATAAIAAIWSKALKVPKIGLGDRFFDLGGDSLLAMSVALETETALGIIVGADSLLANVSFGEFARGIISRLPKTEGTSSEKASNSVRCERAVTM
jgi:amino acid adenylation domain-containing protein